MCGPLPPSVAQSLQKPALKVGVIPLLGTAVTGSGRRAPILTTEATLLGDKRHLAGATYDNSVFSTKQHSSSHSTRFLGEFSVGGKDFSSYNSDENVQRFF